jgi:hypothetical protein
LDDIVELQSFHVGLPDGSHEFRAVKDRFLPRTNPSRDRCRSILCRSPRYLAGSESYSCYWGRPPDAVLMGGRVRPQVEHQYSRNDQRYS